MTREPEHEIQPGGTEKAGGVAGTTTLAPGMGGTGLEKLESAHPHSNVPEGILETTASKATPDLTGTAANPASDNHFGEEDHEYISGYKLYSALFGIVCVFFIVLLDFSITATVSLINPYDHCLPRLFHHCCYKKTNMILLYLGAGQTADDLATSLTS